MIILLLLLACWQWFCQPQRPTATFQKYCRMLSYCLGKEKEVVDTSFKTRSIVHKAQEEVGSIFSVTRFLTFKYSRHHAFRSFNIWMNCVSVEWREVWISLAWLWWIMFDNPGINTLRLYCSPYGWSRLGLPHWMVLCAVIFRRMPFLATLLICLRLGSKLIIWWAEFEPSSLA